MSVLWIRIRSDQNLLPRDMENIGRGPTFGDFVTIRTVRYFSFQSIPLMIKRF
jgi:hypothetical protein